MNTASQRKCHTAAKEVNKRINDTATPMDAHLSSHDDKQIKSKKRKERASRTNDVLIEMVVKLSLLSSFGHTQEKCNVKQTHERRIDLSMVSRYISLIRW